MKLDKTETIMLKDAMIEYWHNNMKHSKNEKLKKMFEFMLVDIKQMQSSGNEFKLTLNG
jgi:hypothetical protein